MPASQPVDHRVRVMVWQWAVEGYGVEDIQVKLWSLGLELEITREAIKELVWRSHDKN